MLALFFNLVAWVIVLAMAAIGIGGLVGLWMIMPPAGAFVTFIVTAVKSCPAVRRRFGPSGFSRRSSGTGAVARSKSRPRGRFSSQPRWTAVRHTWKRI